MKILLITEFFPNEKKNFSGGVEVRTYYLAKHLAKKNEVTIICRRRKDEFVKEQLENVKIIRLGRQISKVEANFYSIFSRGIFIIQSLRCGLKQQADLVEGSNFICLISAFIIAKIKKIPAIAWYPDIYGREWIKNFGILTGSFGLFLETLGLLLPWDHIIALSQQTKKKLILRHLEDPLVVRPRHPESKPKDPLHNPNNYISVIYGGVDINFIKKIKTKKYNQPTICCISRLVPYKNVDCLIKATALIKESIPNINCIIIGKGPEKRKLIKLIRELEINKNVYFKEDLSYKQLITILKSSHVFCLPSRIEGFGLVTIEALVSGIPYVIADTPINKEVTKNLGGLYFKSGNTNDLSKKIITLLKDKKTSREYVEKGKKLVKKYSWSVISRKTEEIYEVYKESNKDRKFDYEKLKEIWFQVPADYYSKVDNNIFQRYWHGNKLKFVRSFIEKKPSKVLDVGCADGAFINKLSKTFPKTKFYGIDCYSKAIKNGRKRYSQLNLRVADSHKLPFKDKSFNLLISTETLEHVVDPDKTIRELKRVMKDDGSIIIELDSGSWLFRFVWYFWKKFFKGKVWKDSHLHFFDIKILEALFKKHNLKIIKKKLFNFGMGVCFLLKK